MALRIYNSLTKQKEIFEPLKKGQVSMYVCGPTVYDEPHIGHLRSAYVFDVMRRYMEFSGYRVQFVRNVTDVDDKIIDKARSAGASDLNSETVKVSQKYLKAYREDLKKLGVLEPTREPCATEHISEMLELIGKLIQRSAAYVSDGDVYYDVTQFKEYGKLSGQKPDAMLRNVRIDANEKKKNALDFALWKRAKAGEPAWDSPWGPGRPGWHIECSAMSMKYLGASFDIHGGGRDLIFPHHENEIAQSEALTGQKFAKYWIHHGLITVDAQKMSKSLKNYITLDDILTSGIKVDNFVPLKFLYLATHYSAPLDFSWSKLSEQREIWKKFWIFFFDIYRTALRKKETVGEFEVINNLETKFIEAMNDDFNTPLAMAVLHEMIHIARKSEKTEPGISLAAGSKLIKLGKIFTIFDSIAHESFEIDDADVQTLINEKVLERTQAKRNRNFAEADAIRDQLTKDYGIELIDNSDGTTQWRKL